MTWRIYSYEDPPLPEPVPVEDDDPEIDALMREWAAARESAKKRRQPWRPWDDGVEPPAADDGQGLPLDVDMTLRTKLQQLRTLADRGATAGERDAAARAVGRIEARLRKATTT